MSMRAVNEYSQGCFPGCTRELCSALIHGARPGNVRQSARLRGPRTCQGAGAQFSNWMPLRFTFQHLGMALQTAMGQDVCQAGCAHTLALQASYVLLPEQGCGKICKTDPDAWHISKCSICVCFLFCHKANGKCAADTFCLDENESCS